MNEINCLKCESKIYLVVTAGQDTIRCSTCGARHVIPRPDDSGASWIDESRSIQQQDDSYYRRWMPWAYRLWALGILLIYILARLDSIMNGALETSGLHLSWLIPLLEFMVIVTVVAFLGWGFYVEIRCYGYPISLKRMLIHGDIRWFLQAIALLAIIISISELLIYFFL